MNRFTKGGDGMLTLKKGLGSIIVYFVEIFVIVISVFPILWVVISAFKTNGEILSDPLALPSSISFNTFIELFENYNFPQYFLNSLLAAGVSTVVSLLFYAMADMCWRNTVSRDERFCLPCLRSRSLYPRTAKHSPFST